MSGKRKRLYYKLTPAFAPEPGAPPQIANASVVTCMATGRILDGMGGGDLALAPEIVDALDGRGENPGPRLILSTKELETIHRALRMGLLYYFAHMPGEDPEESERETREALEQALLVAAPENNFS